MLEEMEITNGLLVKYRGSSDEVFIPEGVVAIRDNAFNGSAPFRCVHFPSSLTRVGELAFCHCEFIEEVHTPSLESWLSIHFEGCNANPLSLSARLFIQEEEARFLSLPDGLRAVPQRAFEGCISLERVELPSTIHSIEKLAFAGCQKLSSIVFNEGLEEIGYSAFRNCSNLATLVLPSTLRIVSSWAFARCTSLSEVSFPNGTEVIDRDAFYRCVRLEYVSLPSAIQELSDDVFYGCTSLEYLDIPESVYAFGNSVFERCKSIKTIRLHSNHIPAGFIPPKGLRALLAPDLSFSASGANQFTKPLAAGFLRLAAEESYVMEETCFEYVSNHVKDLALALDFRQECIKWLIDKQLIREDEKAEYATLASECGNIESAALILDSLKEDDGFSFEL